MKTLHARVQDGKVVEVLELDPSLLELPPLSEPEEIPPRFGPAEIADLEERMAGSRPWGLNPDVVLPVAEVEPPTPGEGQVVDHVGWLINEGAVEPVYQLRTVTPPES